MELGYETIVLTDRLEGDVNDIADYIYSEIRSSIKSPEMKKRALLFGGEPTVQHHGNGIGWKKSAPGPADGTKLDGTSGITFYQPEQMARMDQRMPQGQFVTERRSGRLNA